MKKILRNYFLFSVLCILFINIQAEKKEEKIQYLKKAGEITEGFSNEESNYFWSIDDFCCDDEDNLYVADSGWNKIFKFNSKGQFIASFGKKGQGPGEFFTRPKSHGLRISFGNDGYLYITDSGNNRLSIFSKKGEFIKNFSLPRLFYDRAQVNSKGDIYLISKSRENVVDCYDKDFKLRENFLDKKFHFKYPFYEPKSKFRPNMPKEIERRITDVHLNKVITKNDHLIAYSNNSLTVFHFNEKNKLVNEFMIENEIFLEDFKKRLKSAVSRGGFISPLQMFKDKYENLCFCYWNNSIQYKREIYRYKIDGTLLDILRFPEIVEFPFCADGRGNFCAALGDGTKIGIYRIE